MNQPLAEEIRFLGEGTSLLEALRAFQAAVRESSSPRPANDNSRPAAGR